VSTAATALAARARSPPKYLDGPRVATATTPERTTSTLGVNASTAATTGSNILASRPRSCSTTCRVGQRP
jgi:hypothetical protein